MAGDVDQVHPNYEIILPDWQLMRDAIAGETTVKAQGEVYLPKPQGFTAQDDNGEEMYKNYMIRGKFPEIMGPSLRGMVGIIHRIPAEIELPPQLEPLVERATIDGLPLAALHERITYEVLATGRYGLLVDMPADAGPEDVPYIAGYKAETIINWNSVRSDFYVLDETHLERDGFDWLDAAQYRVLELIDGIYVQTLWSTGTGGQLLQEAPIEPQMRGGAKFEDIPFVVVGSTDVSPDLDEIPLIGVARCAFNMYRLDTDYKWQLFMSGQETLFVISDAEQTVETVGAGVVINLPAQSDAKYVGPSGSGINSHKAAIEDERQQALIQGARIFDTERKTAESGEALRMRFAAQTASLTTIALNSAKGLERVLKFAAQFVGADPDSVIVKPSLNFIDATLDPVKAKALMELWMGGAISKQTLYENLQKGDIATYDRNFQDEEELISQETPDIVTPPTVPVAPTVTAVPAKPALKAV